MRSVVCTLFEGNYSYGVAVLVNSLYKSGFKGDIYVGYKGELPFWAEKSQKCGIDSFTDTKMLAVSNDIRIFFVVVETKNHFTNYKPDFMLALINGPAKDAEILCYYDPDIVQVAPWRFIEDWVQCGVAVCEDVNSTLSEFHPRRMMWRTYFFPFGHNLTFKTECYVNGGFLGISKSDFSVIDLWKTIQDQMGYEIGGLGKSIFKDGEQLDPFKSGDFYAFGKTDQDALNASLEACDIKISYMNKAAMGFENGTLVMAHAIGKDKPWSRSYLRDWLIKGKNVKAVDRLFWNNARGSIHCYSKGHVVRKKIIIKCVAFLSRFISK